MVYCPGCGEQASKNATFCDYCGGDLSQGHPGLVESPDDASPEGLARTGEGASSLRRYVLVSLCSIFGAFLFGAFVFLGLAGQGREPDVLLFRVLTACFAGACISGLLTILVTRDRPRLASPTASYSGERSTFSGSRSSRAAAWSEPPVAESIGRVSILRGVLLSLLTFGFYLFFWKSRQMKVLNSWLGRREHSFWKWLLLSLLSCGLYTLYHEYKTGRDINEIQRRMGWPENRGLGFLSVLMTLLGAGLLTIVLQQDEINKFYRQPLTGNKRPRLKFK